MVLTSAEKQQRYRARKKVTRVTNTTDGALPPDPLDIYSEDRERCDACVEERTVSKSVPTITALESRLDELERFIHETYSADFSRWKSGAVGVQRVGRKMR